ncbi:hypothetical protein L873DRAFT_1790547 [Choiromyces venosus 120613-1]|uniref:Mating factor alpha precursor N-terminal domain-containing protein n=1 Tax=Choiromyces venosus 120613-1 TaxID=1336337 RepID=A0A3N4JIH0_9PEZI|nr:hypothetical protein L873DRAFT_1790547 [Choiromyces venosus 120613-1]
MQITILFLATLLGAVLAEPVPMDGNADSAVQKREPEAEAWHARAGAPMAIWQKRNAEADPEAEAEAEAEAWTGRPGRGAYRRNAHAWDGRPGRGAYKRSAEAWHARAGVPAYTLSKREAEAEPEPIRFQPVGNFQKE